jgi:hypothetical protein
VAPLTPFLDPASPAFENPEKYGYKKFCHSLEDHRKAIIQPSWKHMLSYETNKMTRNDIVKATYEAAKLLNRFKLKYALIDEIAFRDIERKIEKSMTFIEKIDRLLTLSPDKHAEELVKLKKEIEALNRYSICGKNELKWGVQKNYANICSLAPVGLEQLYEDYAIKIRHQLSPRSREPVKLDL